MYSNNCDKNETCFIYNFAILQRCGFQVFNCCNQFTNVFYQLNRTPVDSMSLKEKPLNAIIRQCICQNKIILIVSNCASDCISNNNCQLFD